MILKDDETASQEGVANIDEVQNAVENLTEDELGKLKKIAKQYNFFGLPKHTDGEDILQKAILGTLEGNRHWKKGTVSFFKHIQMVMYSIASHEKRDSKKKLNSSLEGIAIEKNCLLPQDKKNREEEKLSNKLFLEKIENIFSDDDDLESIMLLGGLREGLSRQEIQNLIDPELYDTVMKRIRRMLKKKGFAYAQ